MSKVNCLNVLLIDDEPDRVKALEEALHAGALGFTFAQTPVIVELTDGPTRVTVHMSDGTERAIEGSAIPAELAAHVFARDGAVREIRVSTAAGRD